MPKKPTHNTPKIKTTNQQTKTSVVLAKIQKYRPIGQNRENSEINPRIHGQIQSFQQMMPGKLAIYTQKNEVVPLSNTKLPMNYQLMKQITN